MYDSPSLRILTEPRSSSSVWVVQCSARTSSPLSFKCCFYRRSPCGRFPAVLPRPPRARAHAACPSPPTSPAGQFPEETPRSCAFLHVSGTAASLVFQHCQSPRVPGAVGGAQPWKLNPETDAWAAGNPFFCVRAPSHTAQRTEYACWCGISSLVSNTGVTSLFCPRPVSTYNSGRSSAWSSIQDGASGAESVSEGTESPAGSHPGH